MNKFFCQQITRLKNNYNYNDNIISVFGWILKLKISLAKKNILIETTTYSLQIFF